MFQDVGFGGVNFGYGGGKLQVVFSKASEKGSDVGRVGGGVGVVDDDIVKVSRDALEAFDDLVDYLDEPAGGGTAAMQHDEPLEKPVMCVEGGEGNASLVDGLIWWKEETKSYRKRHASFTQRFEDFVDAGDWELHEKLMAFSFL